MNGNWGDWTDSSNCTVTCAGGTKTQIRVCNNPLPANGGSDCMGNSTQTTVCNTNPCPGNDNSYCLTTKKFQGFIPRFFTVGLFVYEIHEFPQFFNTITG